MQTHLKQRPGVSLYWKVSWQPSSPEQRLNRIDSSWAVMVDKLERLGLDADVEGSSTPFIDSPPLLTFNYIPTLVHQHWLQHTDKSYWLPYHHSNFWRLSSLLPSIQFFLSLSHLFIFLLLKSWDRTWSEYQNTHTTLLLVCALSKHIEAWSPSWHSQKSYSMSSGKLVG